MDTLTLLYTATGFVGAAAFVPQIVTLIKDKSGAVAINLGTYSVFTLTTLISFLYAWQNNGDLYFTLVSGVFVLGNATVFSLALKRRMELRGVPIQSR